LRRVSSTMNSDSDEDARPRKVRKGTHSCRECRRRKVRCTFASSNDPICITCYRRGTKCVSQGTTEGLDRHIEPETAFDHSVGDITVASFDDSSVVSSVVACKNSLIHAVWWEYYPWRTIRPFGKPSFDARLDGNTSVDSPQCCRANGNPSNHPKPPPRHSSSP
jgi:hypothetical protein